ncbi:MAG TPA: hypothetical protein VGM78_05945 [Ilumatobacteraceae bacterium]
MKLRKVLLDAPFIAAMLDSNAPEHDAALRVYETLVDNYEAGTDRLFALSPVLNAIPRTVRRSALAPVLYARVAGQHRRAAHHVRGTDQPDVALALVMLKRNKLHAIATTSHAFDTFAVDVISTDAPTEDDSTDMSMFEPPIADSVPHDEASGEPTLEAVSSGTEPQPVPQPTGE